jgi:20S proteasome alpha/beta subunit
VLLEESVYEKLVEESLKRYGTVKAISKVLNELLKDALKGDKEIIRLIYSEKVARTSAKEFEEFRRKLSRRLEA